MSSYDNKYYSEIPFGISGVNLHTYVMGHPGVTAKSLMVRRETKSGVSNPSWPQFYLSNGYMPVTPYVRASDRIEDITLGTATASWGPRPANYDLFPGGSTFVASTDYRTLSYANLEFSVNTPVSDPLYVTLRAKAIANANSNVRHFAGMFETFAELRKTQRMFLNVASTVVRSARAVRKGRFSAAAEILGVPIPKGVGRKRSFSSNWLEYRYGWTPLYSSLFSAAKATYDFYHRREFIRFAYGASKAEYSQDRNTWCSTNGQEYSIASVPIPGEYVLSPWSFSGLRGVSWNVTRHYDRSLKVNVGYIFKVTNPNLSYVNDLGLADPVSVAYELLPLSFVADWFFNVGDVLEQIGAFTGKEFLAGYITYTEKGKAYINSGNLSAVGVPDGITISNLYPASARRVFSRMERQVLTQQPLFGLHSENGLNPKRIADAVSLIRQAFK